MKPVNKKPWIRETRRAAILRPIFLQESKSKHSFQFTAVTLRPEIYKLNYNNSKTYVEPMQVKRPQNQTIGIETVREKEYRYAKHHWTFMHKNFITFDIKYSPKSTCKQTATTPT